MGFRRVRVMMMLLLLSGGFVSGQAAANDDSADDAYNASAFFPEVKAFVPANVHAKKQRSVTASAHRSKSFHVVSKPHAPVVVKSPTLKVLAAVKTSSGFHPKSKPFVPMARSHAVKAKRTHVIHTAIKSAMPQKAKHRVISSMARLPDNNRTPAIMQPVKINLAANNKSVNVMKSSVANLEINDDIQQALQSNVADAKKIAAVSSVKAAPVKADALVKGRVEEKIQARNSKIDVITSASVGIDPNKIDASKAIHSIFVSQPTKAKKLSADAALSAQSAKNTVPKAKADALIGAAAARQAMIDDSEAGKIPVVKVVTADLSKNEFYILGESEPVPEHLKNNPETQMVVLGGEVDEAAKKIMEFKLAALNAARVRAAKELAQKQASAKAIAELEIEEKEAMAKLAVAQRAVDDMQKLKKWQKEKENNIGTVVEKVTPEYKKAIVHAVVPEEIHTNAVAQKQEDKLVPIDQIALSAEKIADDLGHEGLIPHINDTVAEVKIAPVLKPAAKKAVAKKKSHTSVERVAAKQINDEIISIKSAKHKKAAKQVVKSKSTEALLAPKKVMINKKQKVSLKHSLKKIAAIKLAKTKTPARP